MKLYNFKVIKTKLKFSVDKVAGRSNFSKVFYPLFIKAEAGRNGSVLGSKTCRGAPIITHLLFVDD
jgi:hypothetical protein